MPLILYQRGRFWHYRGTVAGRKLRGTAKTTDKAIAEQVVASLQAREWKRHLYGPDAVLTFAQAAILYRDAGKATRFLREVEDHWRDMLVRDINSGLVQQAAITLLPTAGPATRNRQVIVPTQAIINHAAELGYCRHLKVKRFPVAKREKAHATWQWVQAFMANAGTPHLAALACFLFLTGARISEALALDWEDIDLSAADALIRQTKTASGRRAHVPPALVTALANLSYREGPVFRFRSRSNCKTQWMGACRRAGIKRLGYHALRHGFATAALQAGIDPVTVAKLGGWKTPAHVFATYGHASDDRTLTDRLVNSTPATQKNGKRNAAK